MIAHTPTVGNILVLVLFSRYWNKIATKRMCGSGAELNGILSACLPGPAGVEGAVLSTRGMVEGAEP